MEHEQPLRKFMPYVGQPQSVSTVTDTARRVTFVVRRRKNVDGKREVISVMAVYEIQLCVGHPTTQSLEDDHHGTTAIE